MYAYMEYSLSLINIIKFKILYENENFNKNKILN